MLTIFGLTAPPQQQRSLYESIRIYMNIKLFRILIIFAGITLIVNTQVFSAASDFHLVPEEGMYGVKMFNPYYEAVGNRLLPSNHLRICQAVVFPSFSEEYAV